MTITSVAVVAIARLGTPRGPTELGVMTCGALAAAASMALDDPAHALLQPMPVTARARLAHRLALLAPVTAAAATLLILAARLFFDGRISKVPSAASLAALVTSAVAATAWLTRRFPEHAAEGGATAAFGWSIAGVIVPDSLVPETVALAWLQHPWSVLAIGLTLIVIATGARTS